MRLNRFLASLLALMMVFSLLPAFGLTAGAEEEGQITLVDTENEGQIAPAAAALIPDVDPEEETDESPALWVGGVEVDETNAGNIFGDGKVSFNFDTNTLTFTAKRSISGVHNGALIDAANMDLTIVLPSGQSFSSGSATKGINVTSGTLTVNGKLTVSLYSGNAEACVCAEKGLTVNGDVDIDSFGEENCIGILSEDGPVTINGAVGFFCSFTGIYCGSGDVKVTGSADFLVDSTVVDSACVYTADGGVELGSLGFTGGKAAYTIVANGPVSVENDVTVNNNSGNGIRSLQGGISIGGDADITVSNAFCLDAGSAAEGITVNGKASLQAGPFSTFPVLNAAGGPITVGKDLTVSKGGGQPCVLAKKDITVGGNVDIHNELTATTVSPNNRGVAMRSEEGSILVTGDCFCSSKSESVFARKDIRVGGKATFHFGISDGITYGVRAEEGVVSIGDSLEVTGVTKYMVYGSNGIDIGGGVTIGTRTTGTLYPAINTGEYGLYSPNGTIAHNSGTWDILATVEALHAAQGINIGGGSGVVYPRNGLVTALSGYSTVTEEDGATVATHVIIDDKPAVILTFDAGENTTLAYDTVALPYGSNYTTPPWPSREGDWVYLGWYLNPGEGTNAGIGDKLTSSVIFTKDTTLYFHWRLPGDVDGNGKVELADVILLARYVKANGEGIAIVKNSGDIDGNNAVELADVILLARYVKAGCTGYEIH